MFIFRFCIFLLCLSTPYSFGGEEKDEISVVLGSEHALLPVYIEPIENDSSSLPPDYLSNIRSIISFDMSNNGMTHSLEGKEKEKIQNAMGVPSFDGTIDLEKLRQNAASYLLRWKIHDKTLDIKVALVTSGMVRSISPVVLSGDLSKDRSKLHQLSDCIHSILFGKPGIAHTKIVYVVKKRTLSIQKEPQYLSEVVEVDYDGHNARTITNTHSLTVTPLWIPARASGVVGVEKTTRSHSVLYVSYELGQPKIFIRDLRNGYIYRATLMRGNQLTPAISRNGTELAFCSDISGTADLYVVDFESGVGAVSKPRQVFHSRGSATACPTFSPDGKRIAFVSNKDGSPKIYVMDIPAPGTKVADLRPKLISKRCRENTAPAWSPDGKKIAYSAKNQGDRQIWIYDFERGQEQELTEGSGSKESPSWAQDSLHLVFHAYSSGSSDIYLVNLNQPKPVKISSGPGEKQYANWEP